MFPKPNMAKFRVLTLEFCAVVNMNHACNWFNYCRSLEYVEISLHVSIALPIECLSRIHSNGMDSNDYGFSISSLDCITRKSKYMSLCSCLPVISRFCVTSVSLSACPWCFWLISLFVQLAICHAAIGIALRNVLLPACV